MTKFFISLNQNSGKIKELTLVVSQKVNLNFSSGQVTKIYKVNTL